MKKILLILFLFPIIFTSCKKEEKNKESFKQIDISEITEKIKDSTITEKIKDNTIFTITLHEYPDDVSKEILLNQRLEFENYLYGSDYFLHIKFIDKEIALANLQEDLGEDIISVLEFNPLQDSYDAHVKAEFVSQDGLKEIEDFINNFKGSDIVQDIVYLNLFPKSN
jgi:cell division protein FtsX